MKFHSKYDFFQGMEGFIIFFILVSINIKIGTLIIAFSILIFGIYKAFGRELIIEHDKIKSRTLFKINIFDFSDIKEVSFSTNLYGKSFIKILTKSNNKSFGYFNQSDWQIIKDFFEKKGIKCTNNV